jgi:hypothetical protein
MSEPPVNPGILVEIGDKLEQAGVRRVPASDDMCEGVYFYLLGNWGLNFAIGNILDQVCLNGTEVIVYHGRFTNPGLQYSGGISESFANTIFDARNPETVEKVAKLIMQLLRIESEGPDPIKTMKRKEVSDFVGSIIYE